VIEREARDVAGGGGGGSGDACEGGARCGVLLLLPPKYSPSFQKEGMMKVGAWGKKGENDAWRNASLRIRCFLSLYPWLGGWGGEGKGVAPAYEP
jgi:hypothetical protein